VWLTFKVHNLSVFGELEGGPDRSVVIIASTIVESYLTDLLKSDLRGDISDVRYTKQVLSESFNPEGKLGAFGTKISLAFLLGYLTKDAHADLKNISKIRNKFAHYAEYMLS
jgi:DNA-binding MltR family transcriptional regulator